MDFEKVVRLRKSVREFSSKKPDWRDIIECIDSARYAPMAGNNYTLKFILISEKETIENLSKSAEQPFISETQFVVVVCTSPTRTIELFDKRGEIYCRQQAGAAIENFLLAIENKGLSTCWIGHFNEKLIKKELDIPENLNIEAFFPIGYEKKTRERKMIKREKIKLDNILSFEKYGNPRMKK